jgi:GH35 family endo-1,4-beta-xylanase
MFSKCFAIVFIFMIAGTLKAQSVLTWDFESNNIGDSLAHVSWNPSDIQSVVADDPVASGNKVLKNVVHNYNAAPVLTFVLPDGKTLADYDSLKFKGYFQKGDIAYKEIIAEAYQTKPTGHFLETGTDSLGSYNRAKGASVDWENIGINISNSFSLSDTIYIALGINCSGESNGDTTTWFADDIQLVAKGTPPPPVDTGNVVTNGGFEDSNTGVVDTTDVKGWEIQVAAGVTPLPEFRIVSDTVEEGSRALKVTVHGLGVNQWDIQIVADNLHITPGALYDYSVWAKSEKAGATVNFTTWSQAGGEYKAIRPATLSTQWKKFTMQFTVTDTTRIIRAPIHFYGTPDTGNSIYIDNLVIARHIEVIDSSLIWKGPALATGAPKFLGSAGDAPAANFADYWTQLTPENAGKWGSVGTSADTTQWNWNGLDNDYNYAKDHNLIFKDHNLIWGAQQPSWISALDSAQQINYIETWIRMVGERYPNIDMIDVVNEPLNGHNPPDGGNGRANYKNALGGNGVTGWDWVINAFKLARKYLPNTKLLINDFGILNSSSNTDAYIHIINILKDSSLIDGIGCQAHGLESTSAATIKSNLDKLAATGLPIYISEFDLNIQNDNQQMTKYQELFPVMWQHPDVKGITLWGYIQGRTWLTYSYLVKSNGTARPALFWLAQYIKDNPVGVKEVEKNGLPSQYELKQNYPNPFNPSTTISFSLPQQSQIKLALFDILGRKVMEIANGFYAAGTHSIKLNASNLASGVYFYRLEAGSFVSIKKLMLLK